MPNSPHAHTTLTEQGLPNSPTPHPRKGREGNREGKTPLGSSSSSIVTAVSASGSRRWMAADAARFGGR